MSERFEKLVADTKARRQSWG